MYLLVAVRKSHNKLTLILVIALSLHDIVLICDKTAENIKKLPIRMYHVSHQWRISNGHKTN